MLKMPEIRIKLMALGALFMLLVPMILMNGCAATRTNSKNASDVLGGMPSTQSQQTHLRTISLGDLGNPVGEPALFDNTLVWAGDKQGKLHDPDAIFCMNLVTRRKNVIATTQFTSQAVVTGPQVSAHWITWLDSGLSNGKVVCRLEAQSRTTGKTKEITQFSARGLSFDSLDNDTLVWSQPEGKGASVDAINLSTSKILFKKVIQTDLLPGPHVYGKTVVWEDGKPGEWKGVIHVFDLDTGKERKFPVEGRYAYPKVFGEYVVYSPQAAETQERIQLDVLNLTTSKVMSINAGQLFYWDIGQGYVTWCDYAGSSTETHILELDDHGRQFTLHDAALPFAYGSRIVWVTSHTGNTWVTEVLKRKLEN